MSMAHSLEIRCPLLDHRLVELAFRIPASRKQKLWQGKSLLRALARRRLPADLWKMPKRGFTAPVGPWIAEQHSEAFASEVLGASSELSAHLDERQLACFFNAHRTKRADHTHVLWASWVLQRWLNGVRTTSGASDLKPQLASPALSSR
jgi:asparagine synthase (glutamine-hydrolysing)